MLPAITPPTDNLYKFICLFGLTLFLFFSYSLSFVHDRLSRNHMLLENIRTKAQHNLLHFEATDQNSQFKRSRLKMKDAIEISDLRKELFNIEQLVENSPDYHKKIIALSGDLNKIEIAQYGLKTKIWLYSIFLLTGLLMIFWGFRKWKLKDQNIRDSLLKLDEEIKNAGTKQYLC